MSLLPIVNSYGMPYWKVILTSGKEINGMEQKKVTELDLALKPELKGHVMRSIDWTLDLVSTGDVRRIKELHLICPGVNWPGVLKIKEPGTAFQFKNTSRFNIAETGQVLESQVIGRVDDKATGACTCIICDRFMGVFVYHSNIGINGNTFGSWHPRIASISSLALDVQGLTLS